MKTLRYTLFAAASMATLAAAPCASAADGSTSRAVPSGSGLVDQARQWLVAAAAGPLVSAEPTSYSGGAAATAERSSPDRLTLSAQKPVLDFSPHASVVARDWRGSMKIVGNRTMLVDDLRPTASNRLVMARLATDARITTFVQVGVGEWRIDTNMFPNARAYSEMAGQLGAGFEIQLPFKMRIAGEADYTMLYRDLHYTADEVAPRMLSFVVAIDGRF